MMDTRNYVARLNELAQKTRSHLHFEDIEAAGPDHIKQFTIRAVLNGEAYPDGVGKNKKEAKQNAAKKALEVLSGGEHQDSVDTTEHAAEAPTAPVHHTSITQANYVCWLNEYSHQNRVTIRPVESTRPGPNDAVMCCSFVVGGKEYPAATGKTKKEAKEEAAKLVYHEICGSKTTETADESHDSSSAQQKGEINLNDICNETRHLSLNNSFTETNYIGLVNHYCQKTNSSHKYSEEGRSGPSHNLQFSYKLVINNKDYPVGEGKSVKEAKQNAAQLAWSALQEQSDWNSKVSFRSTVSEDGAPSMHSAPSQQESHETSSSSSIIFSDSSHPSRAQMPLRSTASEHDGSTGLSTSLESLSTSQSRSTGTGSSGFTDSSSSSKDQHAVKDKNMGNIQNEPSTQSRFTTDFEPMECLGSGAFGRVHKAKDKLLEKYYAVKIVGCEEFRKALREVGTLSDLQHSNIVRYYTSWTEDSGYQWDISDDSYSSSESTHKSPEKFLYIQMELCDTKTLRKWIEEKNAESVRDSKRRLESLTIAQQIVSGVEYIHSKKCIHRDLKPENILFGLDGKVKIGDFGLVTKDDDGDDVMDKTADKGTPSYMAPEQRWKTYDRQVDIFALGLIYLELLWKVFTGFERVEVFTNAKSQKLPKDFSRIFPEENQIIKSMLREKPQDRPEAAQLKAELEKWAANAQNMPQENATI